MKREVVVLFFLLSVLAVYGVSASASSNQTSPRVCAPAPFRLLLGPSSISGFDYANKHGYFVHFRRDHRIAIGFTLKSLASKTVRITSLRPSISAGSSLRYAGGRLALTNLAAYENTDLVAPKPDVSWPPPRHLRPVSVPSGGFVFVSEYFKLAGLSPKTPDRPSKSFHIGVVSQQIGTVCLASFPLMDSQSIVILTSN